MGMYKGAEVNSFGLLSYVRLGTRIHWFKDECFHSFCFHSAQTIFKSFQIQVFFASPSIVPFVVSLQLFKLLERGLEKKLISAGLPDSIVSNQKITIWENLEGLGMEKVGVFFGHLEFITAVWYILWLAS
jgi:hypothetical protein